MKKKKFHDVQPALTVKEGNSDLRNCRCPYCKYQFTLPNQHRINCPNCAREIVIWT